MFTKETSTIWPRPRYYIPQIVLFSIGTVYFFWFFNAVTDALQPVIQAGLKTSNRDAYKIASLISLTIQFIPYGCTLIYFILDHNDRKRRLASSPTLVCPKCGHLLDPIANECDTPSNIVITIPPTDGPEPLMMNRQLQNQSDTQSVTNTAENLPHAIQPPSSAKPTEDLPLRCPECGTITTVHSALHHSGKTKDSKNHQAHKCA